MNTVLKHKGYIGTIEVSLEDNCLHGKIQFIQDTVTYEGQTPAELDQAFVEAVDDYLATCEELGREPQKPFSGSFNIRVGSELHKAAAVQSIQEGISLNEFVKLALKQRLTDSPSEHQVTHIHRIQLCVEQETDLGLNESEERWTVNTTVRSRLH
ncbi:HicB family protein [Nitrosococcus halophilus Nc 4]|uniref:HicB family protein n=1 Tax=Nitrosococcus halophilus (strain Nc4) TaxID=472759 RepID=D5C3Q4_NITHN|nr:type II toxin-antitoxin system HicB family antitoxin [Nitrosococcus halophilus]ADE15026.1 HicB family protein [Nitrosococcus halophilus Nc 4]